MPVVALLKYLQDRFAIGLGVLLTQTKVDRGWRLAKIHTYVLTITKARTS